MVRKDTGSAVRHGRSPGATVRTSGRGLYLYIVGSYVMS